jgi:hypothetical protein
MSTAKSETLGGAVMLGGAVLALEIKREMLVRQCALRR